MLTLLVFACGFFAGWMSRWRPPPTESVPFDPSPPPTATRRGAP